MPEPKRMFGAGEPIVAWGRPSKNLPVELDSLRALSKQYYNTDAIRRRQGGYDKLSSYIKGFYGKESTGF